MNDIMNVLIPFPVGQDDPVRPRDEDDPEAILKRIGQLHMELAVASEEAIKTLDRVIQRDQENLAAMEKLVEENKRVVQDLLDEIEQS